MPKKGKTKQQIQAELEKTLADQVERERLQAEQDAIKRAEKEEADRIEAERQEQLAEEERMRLESKLPAVEERKSDFASSLEQVNKKKQDAREWDEYLKCSHRPRVEDAADLQTYFSILQDTADVRLDKNIPKERHALHISEEAEEVIKELYKLSHRSRENFQDASRVDWCFKWIQQFRELQVEKKDDAFLDFLKNIELLEQNSRNEVMTNWGKKSDLITVGFWGHMQTKGFRAKVIDWKELGIQLELPKAVALQNPGHMIGCRAIYTPFDSIAPCTVLANEAIGGVLRVDLLSIPAPPKRVKNWTVSQSMDELDRLHYPSSDNISQVATGVLQPCKVEYCVPKNVVIRTKEPTVCWWDPQGSQWIADNISEINFDADTRKISFSTLRLASFSITQPRHCDLPYDYWHVTPREDKSKTRFAELKVKAARFDFCFAVKSGGVSLKSISPPCDDELSGLMFNEDGSPKVLSPAELLMGLKECGINLMPENCDAEPTQCTVKSPDTVERAYSDLAEISALYDIA